MSSSRGRQDMESDSESDCDVPDSTRVIGPGGTGTSASATVPSGGRCLNLATKKKAGMLRKIRKTRRNKEEAKRSDEPRETTPTASPNAVPQAKSSVNALLQTVSIQDDDLHYNMDHLHRGCALLLNNTEFQDKTLTRHGAEHDVTVLTSALGTLGFRVRSKANLTAQQMVDAFEKEVKRDHWNEDCFVCVLMSHGAARDVILGVDGKEVELKSFVDCLGGDNCPSLSGKPKIFLIIACRGEKVDEGFDMPDGTLLGDVETDGEEEESISLPFEQDFLYVYSTVEGYMSFRAKNSGTHFVQSLGDVIEQKGTELEVCQLLTLASSMTAREFKVKNKKEPEYHGTKQCPCFVSCLTKALYFKPKSPP